MNVHGVASRYRDAMVVGIDESDTMHVVSCHTPTFESDASKVVVSAQAVHHRDAPHKADLFIRAAGIVASGGRFDVIVPDDPADAVTLSMASTTSRAPSPCSSSGTPPPDSSLTLCGSIETSPSWSATYRLVDRHCLDRSPIPA